jgi:hypothetical protein
LARHGDRAAALAALREGLETAGATGELYWDAELRRLTGTVLLAENKLEEGQASLQQAIRIAQTNRRNRGNCARRRASPGFGANRAGRAMNFREVSHC